MKDAILAADLGTSSSSAALVAGDTIELVKEPSSGSWAWPSAVCLTGEGLLVGSPAERRGRLRPELYRAEFKRDLGSGVPIPFGERAFLPEQLMTATLAALKAEAERMHGARLDRAVVTVPASYGPADVRRHLMISAAEAAGFGVVELLAEPVAAAMAPVAGPAFADGELVLVYDLGGGTFDAALVQMGAGHRVLGSAALDDCGGRDIDALVYGELRGADGLAAALAAPDAEGRRNRLRFGDLARRLKHQLSEVNTAEDVYDPTGQFVQLDRGRLVELVIPALDRTVYCCRDLLDRCRVPIDRVAAVLLVGGSTRMPVIAEFAGRTLGRPVRRVRDPDLAVTLGAARWAARASQRFSTSSAPERSERPLRWLIPGGSGVLLRWLAGVGDACGADQPVALLRLPDGALHELRVPAGAGGTVSGLHYETGATVTSADWLLTLAVPVEQPVEQPGEPAGQEPEAGEEPAPSPARLVNGQVWHDDTVTAACFGTVRGRLVLATASKDEYVRLWDADSAELLHSMVEHDGPVWCAVFGVIGGRSVLVTGDEDGKVVIWDPVREREISSSDHFGTPIRALAFTTYHARPYLAIGGEDGSVWCTECSSPAADLAEPDAGYDFEDPVHALAFTEVNGALALAIGGDDDYVEVWDFDDEKVVETYDYDGEVRAIAATTLNGRPLLAIGGKQDDVHLWDPGKDVVLRVLQGHFDTVRTVAFGTLDGATVLASGGKDDTVILWNVGTGARLHTFTDHDDTVRAVALAPYGSHALLATAGKDRSAMISEITR